MGLGRSIKGRPERLRRFTINCDTVEHATPTNTRAPTARSISAATRARRGRLPQRRVQYHRDGPH